MTAHPKHALPIGWLISGYQVVRMIGQGGFGIVYEATNPVTGERVAIKEFYPSAIASRQEGTIVLNNSREVELYATVLERFAQTAGAQFQFRHPNILKVYNYVPAENTGYMITEFIEGESLRGFLHQFGGHFPSADMFHVIMEQVVGAIGYVHRQGHIHRDIAPDNVMIDRFQKPTVIDFGALKRDLRGSNAYSSIVVLREDYAPPEQQDPSLVQGYYTDIFALAGTMYCTLSGAPPIRATTRSFTHAGDPYVPIAQASKISCPPEVFDAIDQALRLPAHDRPQTMEDFARLLHWDPNFGDDAGRPGAEQPPYLGQRTTIERPGQNSATRAAPRSEAAVSGHAAASSARAPVAQPAAAAADRQPQRRWTPAMAFIGIGALILVLIGGLYVISPMLRTKTADSPGTVVPPIDPQKAKKQTELPKGPVIIPDGQYRAVLGFPNPRGARCLARSDVPAVTIASGRISFESEDLSWRGTINQVTGEISIPNQGIMPIRIGALAKHGLSITGHFKDAVLHSGLCGTGFFRILR